MKQIERNQTIDVLRGIAVISVIAGHAIQRGLVTGYEDNILFKLIYTYHMPLFMLLSGYTLYLSNPKYDATFIIKKFKSLIIPTIVWSYLLYFMKDFTFTGLSVVNFPDGILEYTKRLILHPDLLVWFLYVVFVCTFIFYIGKKFFSNQLLAYLIIVTIILELLPFSALGIWRIKLHLPIFIAGYYIAIYKDVFFKCLKYTLAPCIVFYILMASKWSFSSSKTFQWLISFAGITIIYYIVKIIRIREINKALSYLGKYSLEIYLFQSLVLNIGIGNGTIRILSIFISASVLSIIFAYLTKKNTYTNAVLYGRFKWMPSSLSKQKV